MKHNGLVANSDKSYFFISSYERISLKILDFTFESSPFEELLNITSNSRLTVHKHIISSRSRRFKANQKLSALTRIAKYLNIDKRKIRLNSFVTAQFNYCPFMSMYHKKLLERDHSFTIRKRNIQYLAIEAYNVKNGLSPVIMNDVSQFSKNSDDELRSGNHLQRTNLQTQIISSSSIITSKLHILAADLLRHWEQKYGSFFQRR